MDQLKAHGELFLNAGLDHAMVGREYAAQMDDLLARLEAHLPIDPGHGLESIESRAGLTDLLTRVHPYSAEFANSQVPIEIRKNLWQLAYGDKG